MKDIEYGSEEYKSNLAAIRPVIQHHYANNRHHPEWQGFQERWLDVTDYKGIYQVSDFGRVRSLTRRVNRPTQGDFSKVGLFLRAHLTPNSYLRIQLKKDGASKNLFVHRLVARAFLPNAENKPLVNHIDGNKTNNYHANLEWSTNSENQQHAYDSGLLKPHVKHVIYCRSLNILSFGTGDMERQLKARGFNANASSIWNCINGESDTHLGLKFDSYNIQEVPEFSFFNKMTLPDLLELLCDWKDASKRNKNGDIMQSLITNAQRFHIAPDLLQILQNTVREHFQD
jgi:hypothetical protein